MLAFDAVPDYLWGSSCQARSSAVLFELLFDMLEVLRAIGLRITSLPTRSRSKGSSKYARVSSAAARRISKRPSTLRDSLRCPTRGWHGSRHDFAPPRSRRAPVEAISHVALSGGLSLDVLVNTLLDGIFGVQSSTHLRARRAPVGGPSVAALGKVSITVLAGRPPIDMLDTLVLRAASGSPRSSCSARPRSRRSRVSSQFARSACSCSRRLISAPSISALGMLVLRAPFREFSIGALGMPPRTSSARSRSSSRSACSYSPRRRAATRHILDKRQGFLRLFYVGARRVRQVSGGNVPLARGSVLHAPIGRAQQSTRRSAR